jgi:hypothetical protein
VVVTRPLLNDHQTRRLGIRFSRLIAEAGQLDELLGRSAERAPASDTAGTSSVRIQLLRQELRDLVVAVRATAARFAIPLESERLPAERQVEFWAALWQTRVLDCRPARLRGSGPVSPELVESLGPEVDRIVERLDRIRRSANDQSEADSDPTGPGGGRQRG